MHKLTDDTNITQISVSVLDEQADASFAMRRFADAKDNGEEAQIYVNLSNLRSPESLSPTLSPSRSPTHPNSPSKQDVSFMRSTIKDRMENSDRIADILQKNL